MSEEVWGKSYTLNFIVVRFELIIKYWCGHEGALLKWSRED